MLKKTFNFIQSLTLASVLLYIAVCLRTCGYLSWLHTWTFYTHYVPNHPCSHRYGYVDQLIMLELPMSTHHLQSRCLIVHAAPGADFAWEINWNWWYEWYYAIPKASHACMLSTYTNISNYEFQVIIASRSRVSDFFMLSQTCDMTGLHINIMGCRLSEMVWLHALSSEAEAVNRSCNIENTVCINSYVYSYFF